MAASVISIVFVIKSFLDNIDIDGNRNF